MSNPNSRVSSYRLIINADDFGLTRSVNQAIIETYKAGNLTSATLMVNMPGTEHAVDQAKKNPGLAVGLHFCITEGFPLSEAKTLIDDSGRFLSRGQLIRRIILGRVDRGDIAEEFEAQLDKFNNYGLTPTHSDSHQHTMMIPFVFDSILPVLKKHQLKIRVVNPANLNLRLLFSRPLKYLKQSLNALLSKRIIRKYPNKTNQYLVSIHELNIDSSRISKASYTQLVEEIDQSKIVELMVHLYLPDHEFKKMYAADFDQKSVFIDKCILEHKLLSQKPIFDNFELCTFREID
ncbi:MAG: ChbG/HpnK family deacetylase [Reichenbachiella sp.]|uniref:carbohydrate deacetylase n=1 Tax=Reichenbachiella sp. TaxID=2184521 RepID=UPI00326368A5